MCSKSSHCNVSKLSDSYNIARSFTLFSLRKCMQLHHFYCKNTRTLSTLLWNLMSRNLTSLRYKCQFLINIQSQNNKVKHHLFLSQQYATDRLGFESVGFEERGYGITRWKGSRCNEDYQQQTEPTNRVDAWIWTCATWWEASVPNSAPTVLPIPIPTLALSYWHQGNHFGLPE